MPQTSGSRALGAVKELEVLATKLLKTDLIKRCEVIDPRKIRLDYLNRFDSFYINCDPRAFNYEQPDWMDLILKKVSENPGSMFPSWRPLLDKKYALTLIQNEVTEIVPTIPFADYKPDEAPVILKGDGYSLNSVIESADAKFQEFMEVARQEPSAYVIQPFLEGRRFTSWVYDTSSKKIMYLKDGYTKLNIWWLNGRVVGMLMTVSDSTLISDKGFNTVPIIK